MLKNFEEKYPVGSLVAYIVLFCAILLLLCWGTKSISGKYVDDTDRAMETIKSQQREVGRQVEIAGSRVDNVGQTLHRVGTAISNSEERAREITAGINRSKDILGECQTIIEENRRIFESVEKVNRPGEEEGKPN